jgi:hypothetical protein
MNKTRPHLLYNFFRNNIFLYLLTNQPTKHDLNRACINREAELNNKGCIYSARTYSVWLFSCSLHEQGNTTNHTLSDRTPSRDRSSPFLRVETRVWGELSASHEWYPQRAPWVWAFYLQRLWLRKSYVCCLFTGKLRPRGHPGEGSQWSGMGTSWEDIVEG